MRASFKVHGLHETRLAGQVHLAAMIDLTLHGCWHQTLQRMWACLFFDSVVVVKGVAVDAGGVVVG